MSAASASPAPLNVGPLTEAEIAAICALAETRGWSAFRVDLEGCTGKRELLERMARALSFPDWFGFNWDALRDCLTDLSWQPMEGYVIVLENADTLYANAPEELAIALELLGDAATDWAERGVPMRVYVDLDESGGASGLTPD
jgi:RNAse (barnase) inhibitor barstar